MSNPRSQRLMTLREQAQLAMARMGPSEAQQAFESMDLPRLIEELRIYHEELEIQNDELAVAQTKSEAARARYQLLFSLLPMPALLLESFGVIVEDNDASQDWLGPPRRYQHHDLRLNQALSREDRPRLNRLLSSLDPMSKASLINITLTGFDHNERRVDLHAARLPQDFHQEPRYLVVLLDRTAEKARLSEHGVFNALLDSNDDITFATDPYGRLMLTNQAFLNKLGLPRDRALGRKLTELLPPSAASLDVGSAEDQPLHLPSNRYLSIHWPGDAELSALAVHRFAIRNRNKELIGYATTCRDSSREQQEAGAQDLAHRALMELPLAVAICDEQGLMITVNEAFEARTGFTAAALLTRTLDRLFPPDSAQGSSAAVWHHLRSHEEWHGQRVLRRASGQAWISRVTAKRLRTQGGPSSRMVVWVFQDAAAQAIEGASAGFP